MEGILDYVQFQMKLRKRKMEELNMHVEVSYNNITMNEEIVLDNERVIGGYNDIGQKQIKLVHVLKGEITITFRDNFSRDAAINLLRNIFSDESSDSGASSESTDSAASPDSN